MKRRADSLSDAVLRDPHVATITGNIVGHFATGGTHTLIVQVPADRVIEIEVTG